MKKLFKNRNFALLFYGRFVSSIGNVFFNFAISWYILELTNSALQAGLFMATGAVIQIALTPFTGVIADRFSKVKIVVITDYIRGIAVVISGIIIYFEPSLLITMIVLYATTIMLSLNHALFEPAVSGLQAEVVPKDEYQSANATMSMIYSLQGIIGIILGGTLYSLLGVYWIFIIDGVSFVLSAFSEMFINVKHETREQLTVKNGLHDFKEGIRYLFSKKGLMAMMLGALFLNFAFTPFFANGLPYLFNVVLESTPLHYSFLEVSYSIGALLGAMVIGNITKQLPVRKSVATGLIGMVVMFILSSVIIYLIVDHHIRYNLFLITIISVMFLFGLAMIYMNTPLNTAFMKSIDENYRGRAFGVIGTLSSGLVPISLLYGGIVLELFGVITLIVMSAVIVIIISVYFLSDKSIKMYLDNLDLESKTVLHDIENEN